MESRHSGLRVCCARSGRIDVTLNSELRCCLEIWPDSIKGLYIGEMSAEFRRVGDASGDLGRIGAILQERVDDRTYCWKRAKDLKSELK